MIGLTVTQDASYMLDTETGKIIVGIPSPKENEYRGFGFPLTESLLGATMKVCLRASFVVLFTEARTRA